MKKSRIAFSLPLKGLLLLIALSVFYGYWQHLFSDILPIHECRKSDSLTQAIQYFKGASFFEPQTNWISEKGNRNAAAEFPLIYFILGQIWKLTGYHLWIAKVFSIGLLWTSILSLLPLLNRMFKSENKSLVFVGVLFSFPVLYYYTDTLLPNVFSFSFLLLASAQLYRYWEQHKISSLILFCSFLCLAALIKITALIAVLAFFGAFTTSQLMKGQLLQRLRTRKVQWMYGALLLTLVASYLWYRYAINYNFEHGSTIFSTTIRPFWEVSVEERWRILKLVLLEHSREIVPLVGWPIVIIIYLWLLLSRKVSLFTKHLLLFSTVGITAYFILWFWVFEVHDYYFIELLFLPMILLAFYLKYNPKWSLLASFQKPVEYVLLVLIFLNTLTFTEITAGKQNVVAKNSPFISSFIKGNWSWFYSYHNENLMQLQVQKSEIQKLIGSNDTVFCFSDPYANVHLTALDRIGYTNYNLNRTIAFQPQIQKLIQKGASKLVVLKQDIENEGIKPFLGHLCYQKKNVSIYDLKPYRN